MIRSAPALSAALSKVPRLSLHGPWWRVIAFRHVLNAPGATTGRPQPLWGGAAAIYGARFTPKGAFDCIYLAEDPNTALLEVQALVLIPGGSIALASAPWVLVTVEGILRDLVDLTDSRTLQALGTTMQELTGSWTLLPVPPTQKLARAAYDLGNITGFKYASAKNPGKSNFIVFSDRLTPPAPNYLEVLDPHKNLAQHLGYK